MENQELVTQLAKMFRQQAQAMGEHVDKRVAEAERRITFKIETDISKRIEAFFDGYKLTHKKQWEQQRLIENMLSEIENMQLRIIALENRSA